MDNRNGSDFQALSKNARWQTVFKIIVMYTSISCLTGVQRARRGQQRGLLGGYNYCCGGGVAYTPQTGVCRYWTPSFFLWNIGLCLHLCSNIYINIALIIYLPTYSLTPWPCGPQRTFAFSLHLSIFSSNKSFGTSSSHASEFSHLSLPCCIFKKMS
jgi:hypothetical protein